METFLANDGAYVVLGFAAFSIPAATAIVAYFWYKLRRDEMVASLKRELSDRGMIAEEIRAEDQTGPGRALRHHRLSSEDPRGDRGRPPRLDRCCSRSGRAQWCGFHRCQPDAVSGLEPKLK